MPNLNTIPFLGRQFNASSFIDHFMNDGDISTAVLPASSISSTFCPSDNLSTCTITNNNQTGVIYTVPIAVTTDDASHVNLGWSTWDAERRYCHIYIYVWKEVTAQTTGYVGFTSLKGSLRSTTITQAYTDHAIAFNTFRDVNPTDIISNNFYEMAITIYAGARYGSNNNVFSEPTIGDVAIPFFFSKVTSDQWELAWPNSWIDNTGAASTATFQWGFNRSNLVLNDDSMTDRGLQAFYDSTTTATVEEIRARFSYTPPHIRRKG